MANSGKVPQTELVPLQSKHEHLLNELEQTETNNVGLVIRTIYDGNNETELEKFMELLDIRIRGRDKDIERMCNFHYQGFIDSICELEQVRTQAKKLNAEINEIDERLQTASQCVVSKGEELIEARQVEKNIKETIESLSLCLPVFTTYSKLQKQMKEKRYYHALKTLEQLEHLHLPRVSEYRFLQRMKESISTMRENIKDASMSDLKDFLENIWKFSPKIGEVAMRHTAEQIVSDPVIVNRKTKKKRQAPPPPNPFTGEVENSEPEEDLSAQDLIDFSPVYRCLHIHSVLSSREVFQEYYRNQRQSQAKLVLQPPINMHETIVSYRQYLHGVVGFFVVEDHILNTSNGLVSKTYLDELWSKALSNIVNALRTHSAYCTDASLMLQIKDLIMLFCTTLRSYGYPVNQLFELLHEIRDHYNEVLMQRWVQIFREILEAEDFLPVQVSNIEEYNQVLLTFPFIDESLDSAPFPRQFPFSPMVPKVYQQVKEYIYACLKFSEDLDLSDEEVTDVLRKSTHLLLTRTFSGCLSSLFRKPNVALPQVIQIIVDTGYLENATVYLEEFVSNITGVHREGQLGGQSHLFRVARDDAEHHTCEKLKCKINEFLELESYDWMLVEPQGHASSFITDLIAFLHSQFQSFTNIPLEVAQVACKSACKHIADSILQSMLSDNVKQISSGALQQINLDTIQCEQFAASEPVGGMEEGILLQYFTELRQLLDLLITEDWSTYFHDHGQENSKYHLVNPLTAIKILEKMREADKKSVFSALKKSERDKKKLLETVLKTLRQLAVTTLRQQQPDSS